MHREPEAPDLAQLRAELGLPPSGQRLTRDQALILLRAVWGTPSAEGVAWARTALGLTTSRSA